jgi:hypothetical protein
MTESRGQCPSRWRSVLASNHPLIPGSIQKNKNEINKGIYVFFEVLFEQVKDLDDIVIINPSERRKTNILDV